MVPVRQPEGSLTLYLFQPHRKCKQGHGEIGHIFHYSLNYRRACANGSFHSLAPADCSSIPE